ncbi:hypothetical protein SAMN03159448_05918 [Sinorhizobium sp. NFACC03]|nr:hypothetical protein SAMN03159448_05918 [Sinorhizobium sp. NFACC03]
MWRSPSRCTDVDKFSGGQGCLRGGVLGRPSIHQQGGVLVPTPFVPDLAQSNRKRSCRTSKSASHADGSGREAIETISIADQTGHPFPYKPKSLVELDILIDAINRAGRRSARSAGFIATHTAQTTFDAVFLNDIPHRPKVVSAVLLATGHKQLFWLDRSRHGAVSVTKAQQMRRLRQHLLCIPPHSEARPVLGRCQGAFGLCEHAIGSFDHLVLNVSGVPDFDRVNRSGLGHE